MTRKIVPEDARPAIDLAADCAYEEIRPVVGDSWQVARVLRRLAVESWLAGHARGQQETANER